MKVVDWVSYDSDYPDPEDPYSDEREAAVIEAVKKWDIHHCGHCHQNKERGAPLFSDGGVYRESMRNWAVTMEEAWCRSNEVQGIVEALGVGWTASYFGSVDPYSCWQCQGRPKERYETFIGPIHAEKVDPNEFKNATRFSWDCMMGGPILQNTNIKLVE